MCGEHNSTFKYLTVMDISRLYPDSNSRFISVSWLTVMSILLVTMTLNIKSNVPDPHTQSPIGLLQIDFSQHILIDECGVRCPDDSCAGGFASCMGAVVYAVYFHLPIIGSGYGVNDDPTGLVSYKSTVKTPPPMV